MKTLIVIQGPTAVGKTELSLGLAEMLGSPIINADSRQIYREIPIGTAAPTAQEQARVRHYFVGTLSVEQYWSAAKYEQEVLALCQELFSNHDTLVLSGGSMLYIDAVCNGIDDIPTVDEETRSFLKARLEREGLEPLCRELKLLDPEYYHICDLRNSKRVVHALEICYMSGKTYTSFRKQQTKPRPFSILRLGLQRERQSLYERINRRVDQMMDEGLLDEAQKLIPLQHLNSLNTVGYKELFKYFSGEWSLDFAIEKIKQNTRIYSRKQMTWMRRNSYIHWFMPEDEAEIRKFITSNLSAKA